MRVCFFIVSMMFALSPLTAKNPAGKTCNLDFIKSDKNINESHRNIRQMERSCKITSAQYLEFSKRAYLAGEYSLSIWGSHSGLKSPDQDKHIKQELNYYLGISYLGKKNPEQAISVLKKLVFSNDWKITDQNIIQKAHLALIHSYYNSNSKKSENIKYLIGLFKNRYPDSRYLFALRAWNANK